MKNSTKWILLGILSVVFGIYVLGNTFIASVAVAWMIGALLLVSGGFQIVGGFSSEGIGAKILGVLMGVLIACLGISFIDNPLSGVISLTMLVLILLIASGGARIFFALSMRDSEYFLWMLISGALSILLAAYLLANFGAATPVLLGTLMGVEMLFNGFGLVSLGLASRSAEKS